MEAPEMCWKASHHQIAWRLPTTGKPTLLLQRKTPTANRDWTPSPHRNVKISKRITSTPHTRTTARNLLAGKSLASERGSHHPHPLKPLSSSPPSSLWLQRPQSNRPAPLRPQPTHWNLPAASSPGSPPSCTSAHACRKSTRTNIAARPRACRPRSSLPPSWQTCSTALRSSPTPWRGRRTRRTVYTAGPGPRGAIGGRLWLWQRRSGWAPPACWCWTARSGCSSCGSGRAGRKRGPWCGRADGDGGTR